MELDIWSQPKLINEMVRCVALKQVMHDGEIISAGTEFELAYEDVTQSVGQNVRPVAGEEDRLLSVLATKLNGRRKEPRDTPEERRAAAQANTEAAHAVAAEATLRRSILERLVSREAQANGQ